MPAWLLAASMAFWDLQAAGLGYTLQHATAAPMEGLEDTKTFALSHMGYMAKQLTYCSNL